MSHVSKYAFIHAKMHGLMAKSWFDERLRFLFKITSLIDLSKTLFPDGQSAAGESELISDVQRKFENSVIVTLARLLSFFPSPPALLLQALREYDYRNLLTLLREKFSGLENIRLWDIGRYSLFKHAAAEFPQSLRATPFEKYIVLLDKTPLPELEFQIGRQYYEELIGCISALPAEERKLVHPLAETEIRLQNLLWALRLRFYFNMSFGEAEKCLFPLGFAGLTNQVRLVFELPPDDPKQWARLRFGNLFSAQRDGVIDPEAIEGRANQYIYKKTRRFFYAHPFTLASVYAFFRIKKYEARLVTSVSEGIRMGISPREIEEAMGVL
ncbi:MAG: V-type ATPase subunit [Spirochaetales bacterium]|jgi:vacuolar-type H+-ATPase subunit C/Vma6|nr:V-type ATPase subunit [Spirochaetales bacterium]